MREPFSPLAKTDLFRFACSSQRDCFNACCRDLNQVLTPYDVLCLKRFLRLSSGEFLAAYTETSTGPKTGLPVVSLRWKDAAARTCPFVTENGCRVYPARPASCRTYPLARGVSRHPTTGALTEHWVSIREPHCQGFDHGEPMKIADWVHTQQIGPYHTMNDKMVDLLGLKNRRWPGALPPVLQRDVYRALYDLDAFRDVLFHGEQRCGLALPAQALDRARVDAEGLLLTAMQWVDLLLSTFSPHANQP